MNKTYGEITKVAILSLGLLMVCSNFPVAVNAEPVSSKVKPADAEPEFPVKAQLGLLTNALSGGQPKALADLWTPDGSYIDEDGKVFSGREALEKRFAGVFEAEGKVLVSMVPDKSHLLSPNVAISEGVVIPKGSSTPETRYSMVFVKQGATWLIASATETPFEAQLAINPLSSLDWLIGDWVAEKNGGAVKMKAEWTNDKNFIQCRYEISKSGEDTQVETQMVGWDPQRNQIASWSFGAHGGFGRGGWSRKGNSWLVESSGVAPDGKATRAVNVISLSDPNNFSWQSIDRSAGGVELPDTEPIKVQRVVK